MVGVPNGLFGRSRPARETVKSREGQTVTIALADNVAVAYLVKKNVDDIKPGDFIASTGIKGTGGKLHAIEVRIFPESLRGAGEGQYPRNLKPDSVMTNATVCRINSKLYLKLRCVSCPYCADSSRRSSGREGVT